MASLYAFDTEVCKKLVNFYYRRIKRILPIYLVVIIATLLFLYPSLPYKEYETTVEDSRWAIALATNYQDSLKKLGYFETVSSLSIFVVGHILPNTFVKVLVLAIPVQIFPSLLVLSCRDAVLFHLSFYCVMPKMALSVAIPTIINFYIISVLFLSIKSCRYHKPIRIFAMSHLAICFWNVGSNFYFHPEPNSLRSSVQRFTFAVVPSKIGNICSLFFGSIFCDSFDSFNFQRK